MRLGRDARGTVGALAGDEESDARGGHFGWSARARKGCPRAQSRDMAPPRERTVYFVEVPAVSAGLLGPVNTPISARFLRIREVRYCRPVAACLRIPCYTRLSISRKNSAPLPWSRSFRGRLPLCRRTLDLVRAETADEKVGIGDGGAADPGGQRQRQLQVSYFRISFSSFSSSSALFCVSGSRSRGTTCITKTTKASTV